MELASLVARIGGLAIAACYGLVARVYPRSGADYVFVSRTLHPAVGFAASFSFAFWTTFSTGINAGLMSKFAISPLVAAIGLQAHSPGSSARRPGSPGPGARSPAAAPRCC
jgi:amino acid transporter